MCWLPKKQNFFLEKKKKLLTNKLRNLKKEARWHHAWKPEARSSEKIGLDEVQESNGHQVYVRVGHHIQEDRELFDLLRAERGFKSNAIMKTSEMLQR